MTRKKYTPLITTIEKVILIIGLRTCMTREILVVKETGVEQ